MRCLWHEQGGGAQLTPPFPSGVLLTPCSQWSSSTWDSPPALPGSPPRPGAPRPPTLEAAPSCTSRLECSRERLRLHLAAGEGCPGVQHPAVTPVSSSHSEGWHPSVGRCPLPSCPAGPSCPLPAGDADPRSPRPGGAQGRAVLGAAGAPGGLRPCPARALLSLAVSPGVGRVTAVLPAGFAQEHPGMASR